MAVEKPERMTAAARAGYLAPYDTWANRVAVLRFVQDIPLGPADSAYAPVSEIQAGLHRFRELPTLICWGARDFVLLHDPQTAAMIPSISGHRFGASSCGVGPSSGCGNFACWAFSTIP